MCGVLRNSSLMISIIFASVCSAFAAESRFAGDLLTLDWASGSDMIAWGGSGPQEASARNWGQKGFPKAG